VRRPPAARREPPRKQDGSGLGWRSSRNAFHTKGCTVPLPEEAVGTTSSYKIPSCVSICMMLSYRWYWFQQASAVCSEASRRCSALRRKEHNCNQLQGTTDRRKDIAEYEPRGAPIALGTGR
jgi:hypothetical protein